MTYGGGMLAIELAVGRTAGQAFVESVQLARMAATLGGPETLVTSPANSTHVGLTDAERRRPASAPVSSASPSAWSTSTTCIADFERALAAVGTVR